MRASDENVIVGGFIVSGDRVKRVVLRALGPSLGQAGVSGVLADPSDLTLRFCRHLD